MADDYVTVARAAELPPGARRLVAVGGHAVLLLNLAGTLYAVPNACPHRHWPLSESTLDAATLTCARHAWQFDVPSGAATWPPFGYRLRHLPLRQVDDEIQVAWVEPEIEAAH
jgi:3-phenylpropionate/trans-cinnamate dioxygenase ferredoxin subunit